MTDTFTGLSNSKILAQDGEKGKVWDARPFQLVSLLDMLEFGLDQFAAILIRLLTILMDLEKRHETNTQLSQDQREGVIAFMYEVCSFLAIYEIDVEGDTTRAINKLKDSEGRIKNLLYPYILALRNHITDELSKRKFMFIPTAEADYYEHYGLFGPEVAVKFPKANKEITAAGNCYATGNYTACVFHLMRTVEYGARKMVIALNVQGQLGRPVELCDWGTLEKALDAGVKALSGGSRTKMHKKTTFEFYSHAVAQFRNFKDAWRNNVSHTRKVYQPGQTKDIMDNTRQFMQHLAERLKE